MDKRRRLRVASIALLLLEGFLFVIPVKAAIALDGSNSCTGLSGSCSATLTTTNGNDVIIFVAMCAGTCLVPTLSTALTTGPTFRTSQVYNGVGANQYEWYGTSASILSADTVTCHQNGASVVECIFFAISGADTTTIFDSNVAVPCQNQGFSSTGSCSISTSNANDMLIGSIGTIANPTYTYGSGFTSIPGQGLEAAEYKIVSATQSSAAISIGLSDTESWGFIGDAIRQLPTDIQPIKITVSPGGAPNPTMSISGCGVTNSTFSGDGFTHTYSGVTINCMITVTVPTDATNTRYRLKEGSVAVGVSTWTIVTCGGGTCALASNTTYYQLRNLYQATPLSPTAWDAAYTINVKGTVLGIASTVCGTIATTVGGGAASNNLWCDYNRLVTVDKTFGSTWTAFGPNTFTQTTGGNTDNVNYTFAAPLVTTESITPFLAAILFMLFVVVSTSMYGARRKP